MVARWRANPLGMLWPEMDAAFVTSNGNGSGGPDGRVMRSFAQCHSWHDALTVQNEFTRASL